MTDEERLQAAANLLDLSRKHPEVAAALRATCNRYECHRGVGQFATDFPEEFDIVAEGLLEMVRQLPHA
jgi:hypothetical protein